MDGLGEVKNMEVKVLNLEGKRKGETSPGFSAEPWWRN